MKQPSNSLTFALLRMLADGEFHSGQVLARQVSMSRASIHNALREVEQYGVTLYSVRGRGYCLAHPLQWLDAAAIAAELNDLGGAFSIGIVDTAESSNSLLLQQASRGSACGSVLAVEWQSGGRGRFGRPWHAGLGTALTFSLLWRFDCGLSGLSGLSLAVGVAMMRALRKLGVEEAGLKWPNDVVTGRGKLSGILVEAQGDMLGPSAVVIGIGLNLSLPPALCARIDQPVASLSDLLVSMPDRNRVLAVLLRELHVLLVEFGMHGFAAVQAEWESFHAMQDERIVLSLPDGTTRTGIARGVTRDGALELETEQGIQHFNAGEISLREIS